MTTDDYWIDVRPSDLLLQANLDRLAPTTRRCRIRSVAENGVDRTRRDRRHRRRRLSGSVVAGDVESVRRPRRHPVPVLLAGSRIGEDVVVQDSVVMGRVADRVDGVTRSVASAPRSAPGSRSRMSESRLPAETPTPPGRTPARRRARARPTDVLVVGGAGFIGSHSAHRLGVGRGHGRGRRRPLDGFARQPRGDARDPRRRRAAAKCTSTRSTRRSGPRHTHHVAATTSGRPPRVADPRHDSVGELGNSLTSMPVFSTPAGWRRREGRSWPSRRQPRRAPSARSRWPRRRDHAACRVRGASPGRSSIG